ncbi:hypothetical protein [Bauldia litoralis]|uniref:hypothetical protein n=2 Tax=Bauldia litoralis TaxID=665467 RepID=UPI003296DAB0
MELDRLRGVSGCVPMSEMRWNRRSFAILVIAATLLAGCNTTQFAPGASQPSVKPPVTGSAAVFAFAPVDGVPIQILQALSAALNREASAQRLNVVPNNNPSRVYEVRGFVSAVADGQSTRLVYVWDVVDNKGARLHRITGQQAGGRATGDPWTGIGNETVNLAARQTIAELLKWVDS